MPVASLQLRRQPHGSCPPEREQRGIKTVVAWGRSRQLVEQRAIKGGAAVFSFP
jgi:hypothetical protein